MTSCWFCGDDIETELTARAHVKPASSRSRYVRTVLAGCALALALVLWELASHPMVSVAPASMSFERRSLDEVGIALDVPRDWDLELGRGRATFLSRDAVRGTSTRGLRSAVVRDAFSTVDAKIRDLAADTNGYHRIALRRTTLRGAAAVAHTFTAEGLHYDQWWVERKNQIVRIDLWSRAADDDAPEVNRLIVRSAELL